MLGEFKKNLKKNPDIFRAQGFYIYMLGKFKKNLKNPLTFFDNEGFIYMLDEFKKI
jgi:hypothetical protein